MSAQRAAPATSKTCSCCGGDAGKWQQWGNRDTGWGMCRSCLDWLRERGARDGAPEAVRDLYGIPGVHHEPRYFEVFGRRFAILAEYEYSEASVERANQYMLQFPGSCLLHADDSRIVLADSKDQGLACASGAVSGK